MVSRSVSVRARAWVSLAAVVLSTLVAAVSPPSAVAAPTSAASATLTVEPSAGLDPWGTSVAVTGYGLYPPTDLSDGTVTVRLCRTSGADLVCASEPASSQWADDYEGYLAAEVPLAAVTDAFGSCPEGACVIRAYSGGVTHGSTTTTPLINGRDNAIPDGPSLCPGGEAMMGLRVRTDLIGGDPDQVIVVAAAPSCVDVADLIGDAPGTADAVSQCAAGMAVTSIGGRAGDLLDQLFVGCRTVGAEGLPQGPTQEGERVGDTGDRSPTDTPGGGPVEPVTCPPGMLAVGIDGANLPDWGQPLQAIGLVCADVGGVRHEVSFATPPVDLVSRTPLGFSGNALSDAPAISADGSTIVFTSQANDLAGDGLGGPRGQTYLYVAERGAPASTERLLGPSGSGLPNASVTTPWVSHDGRVVAFDTTATGYDGDASTDRDVVVWDRSTGGFQVASVASDGTQFIGDASLAALSDNGRFVLFLTSAALDVRDTNGRPDLYRRDLVAGTTVLVSMGNDGMVGPGDVYAGDVSDDGQLVIFTSSSRGLDDVAGTQPNPQNVYVRSVADATTKVLASSNGFTATYPRVAADGSRFAWVGTEAPGLGVFTSTQAFAMDRDGTYELVSRAPDGSAADATVHGALSLSPDGRYVAFSSAATNLGDDHDVRFDVFVRDLATGPVSWVSRAADPDVGRQATQPAITAAGDAVAWVDADAPYFPATANPDTNGVADVYAAVITPPAAAPVVHDLGLSVSPTEAGGYPAGLDTVAITDIPVGSIPLAGSAIGSTPLRSIDVAASPLRSIPLRSIPLRSIPLRSIPLRSITLSQVPLVRPGGWAPLLDGTDLAGLPLQTVTLGDVADLPTADADGQPIPHPFDDLGFGDLDIASSPLRSIGLASAALGSTPLRSIPLRSIGTDSDAATGYCPATGDVPTSDDAALANWTDLLRCLGYAGPVDGYTTLVEVDIAGTPLRSIPLRSIPLRSIDLAASPLRSIPLRSIELAATPLRSIPLRSIVLDLASSPLRSIPLRSIPLRSIDLASSPLRSIPLRSIPLRSIVVDCTFPGVSCSDTSTQTLGEVADLSLDAIIGDLADLDAALEGFTLGDLLGVTGDATIGTVQDWLQTTQGDQITLGDVLVGLLLRTDYPWEELPVADMGLQALGDPAVEPVHLDVTWNVTGDTLVPNSTTVTVTLPAGAAYVPGSSGLELHELGGDSSASAPLYDPHTSGGTLTFELGSDFAGHAVRVGLDYWPGLRLVEEQASASVTLGSDTTVAEPSISESYAVEELDRPDDDPATAPIVSSTDALVVGHIARPGDVDYYRIPAALVAGKRVSIGLSVPGVDQDLVLYAPADQVGVIDAAPLRSIPLRSIAVEDEGAVTPGTVVPPETLQDIPLRSIPLRSISANRDDTDEQVEILADASRDGYYTVQVSGYNGAISTEPYVLHLRVSGPPAELTCSPRVLPHADAASAPTSPSAPSAPAGTDTLLVVNPSRIDATHGAGEGQRVLDALTALAGRSDLGVTGHVLEVDRDADVRAAYAAWDARPCSPDAANAVVDAIVSLIEASHASAGAGGDSPITSVVLVGGDDTLPQARIPDLTRLSNERDYLADLGTQNPLAGAAATEHLLSDDPYGDRDPIPWLNRLLYVPDVALGRLVETPQDIVDAVGRFMAWEGSLDPSTADGPVVQDALVAGYDFLADGATAVADALGAAYGSANVDRTLIREDWTRADLVGALLGPDVPYIAAVNAHFDHHRSLPAEGNATHREDDLFTTADVRDPDGVGTTAAAPDLDQRLIFSMGCHSGLSVPDVYVAGANGVTGDDWAQAFGEHGAGAYVGNTGFGYGDTETVALSERLMTELASRLDGSMTVGEALTFAKQAYAAQLGVYGAYDEKVLAEATFYGLPMYRMTDAPVPNPTPGPTVTTTPVAGAAGVVASTFDVGGAELAVSSHTAADGSTFQTVGSELPQVTSGRPITPRVDLERTAADGTPARGVLLTALTSAEVPGVRQAFARAVVDASEREPAVPTDVAFPAAFATVNAYRDRTGERSSLVLLPGQFVPDDDPRTLGVGTRRTFTRMAGVVYHSDSSDVTPPTILRTSARANAATATFTAQVGDATSDILRVLVLYRDRAQAWQSAELARGSDGTWTGTGPVQSDRIEYLVQAVDTAGNVAVTTNKGFLFAASADAVPPEVTIASPAAATYEVGAHLVADFGCTDANLRSCSATLDGAPIEDGAVIDTTTPRPTSTFTVTGEDAYGNVTTREVVFRVGYVFSGFSAPVAAGGRTEVKGGSAVPVRFQLLDAHGPVSDRGAIVSIDSRPVDCGASSTTTSDASLAATADLSGLTYQEDQQRWQYVWKTDKRWRGTCRQLVVTFSDGQTAAAVFRLT